MESTEGPPRKYYHLTKLGQFYKDNLKKEWQEFYYKVDEFIKKCDLE
jgi:PadR family transcriptional regulator PadR